MAPQTRPPTRPRRGLSLALLGGAVLLLLAMSAFNNFNLAPRFHNDTLALFLFTGITVVLFLLLLLLLILLARNILKLYGDGRSRVLGSRLRSRMLLGALLLSFAPIVFMAMFSFLLMNRSLDRWFSQPVAHLRDQSLQIALQLSRYVTANARAEAESLARSPDFLRGYNGNRPSQLTAAMRKHRITLENGFILVYRDGRPVAAYQVPSGTTGVSLRTWASFGAAGAGSSPALARPAAQGDLPSAVLRGAENPDQPILSSAGGNDYALGAASFDGGGVVVVALPLPTGLTSRISSIAAGTQEYWTVYRQRRTVRSTFLLLLTLITTLTFFASSWLALFLSKQITRPVEALADAMDAIAAGDYRQRIAFAGTEELSELIASFNQMATDLEESRRIADSSTAQIEQANARLKQRRHELELILETIPSGVVVLDSARNVLQVNRAFLDLFAFALPPHARLLSRESGPRALENLRLEDLLPGEISDDVLRLERRAQRMGLAGAELELPRRESDSAALVKPSSSLSVTVAVLNLGPDDDGHQRRGSVLVVDDVSEVLQAQRQVAWKEVAQRVAHEIKNPLTPISLSAERILRHLDRLDSDALRTNGNSSRDSQTVIRKCGEVILSSVQSMRLLVDQFATLAEFPAAHPRASSLNSIVESALALFQGRLEGTLIETRLSPSLPPVLADPEAMRRALANLIENAAEAMNSSLHRILRIETFVNEQTGMVDLLISDTGPGLNPEVRERLFLPWFSTKQRGTGLGLAIAAKIIQDHHGAIRAEQRAGSGACFVIELPLARASEPVASAENVSA